MSRIPLGFIIAALYNLGIILFSRGFTEVLGAVDPLFGSEGSVGILLWGMAYFSLRNTYAQAPQVAFVFCLEKVYYAAHWALWISAHSSELASMADGDPLTALFFTIYGAGDALFAIFFGWVAWTHMAGQEATD